jgi:hypothetical protein
VIDRIASTIGELRGHPALLAIVILQVATMAVVYFTASGNAERMHERELALIEACRERAP